MAWVAFVDLLVVAVVGDVLVLRRTKDRRVGVNGSAPVMTPGHGVFAVATVVLLLSALEVG